MLPSACCLVLYLAMLLTVLVADSNANEVLATSLSARHSENRQATNPRTYKHSKPTEAAGNPTDNPRAVSQVQELLDTNSVARQLHQEKAVQGDSKHLPVHIPSLLSVLRRIGNQRCRSTEQLADALALSAITQTVAGTVRKAAVLTVCDLRCLKHFLVPFLKGTQRSMTGGFSQHVVVVGLGLPAFVFCDHLRGTYKHRCVLDRFCQNKNHSAAYFESPTYGLATLHKTIWVREAIQLGYSVFLVDLDVYLRRNPLPWLLDRFAEADLVVSGEYCESFTWFQGESKQWKPGDVFEQNTGQYFMNPTANALQLLHVWINETVNILIHRHEYTTDQDILHGLIKTTGPIQVPILKFDHGVLKEVGRASVDKHALNIHRLSFMHFNSFCKGPCGCNPANNTMRQFRIISHEGGERLECDMTSTEVNAMFGFHFNCESDYAVKQQAMLRWVNGMVQAKPGSF